MSITTDVTIAGVRIKSLASAAAMAEDLLSASHAGSACMVTFVNPHCYWLLRHSPGYGQLLQQFDYVCCDGIGMSQLASLASGNKVERISFDSTSLAPPVLDFCARQALSVFLLGGKDGVAEQAAEVLQASHAGLVVAGSHNGYFSDPDLVIQSIRQSGAGVVVCGMGAPYQERFLLALKASGWEGVGYTCGGYLDQLGAGLDYYPAWIDRLNLRFLYRLYKEPARLFRRYFLEYQPFMRVLATELMSKKKT